MAIVDHYEDFYASHNHMPGSDHSLKVTGTVVFRTGGCECDLRETTGNTGTNLMLHLDLVLTPPPEGSAVPEVLTPCPVEWSVEAPALEYDQVEFHVVGTDDEPPAVIKVDHPT